MSIGAFNRVLVPEDMWQSWRRRYVEDVVLANTFGQDLNLWEQVYESLGILDPGIDLSAVFIDSGYPETGYYDKELREVVVMVRGEEFDLEDELTYASQFARHIQNVTYDLDALEDCYSGDEDARLAADILMEADARLTVARYLIDWQGPRDSWRDLTVIYERQEILQELTDYIDDLVYDASALATYFSLLREFSHLIFEPSGVVIAEPYVEKPFLTTQQIRNNQTLYRGDYRMPVGLPDDLMGKSWRLTSSSTVGELRWLALLVSLSTKDPVEIEGVLASHVGWSGDYRMLLSDKSDRPLYLAVGSWHTTRYVDDLVVALDSRPQLKRLVTRSIDDAPNDENAQPWSLGLQSEYRPCRADDNKVGQFHAWQSATGSVGIGSFEHDQAGCLMILAVGPDPETVHKAVMSARENLTIE